MHTAPELSVRQKLDRALADVVELLDKQEVISDMTERQAGGRRHDLVQSLVTRQNLAELQRMLGRMHPADVAFVLEGLPLNRRESVWRLVRPAQQGAVLIELSDPVRKQLLRDMASDDLVGVAEHLEYQDLADLVPEMPQAAVSAIMESLSHGNRSQVSELLAFPAGTVGALMDFNTVRVREDVDVATVLRYLRQHRQLPEPLNEVIVVDRDNLVRGKLTVSKLLSAGMDTVIRDIMQSQPLTFHTDEPARDAVRAFDRYDLVSAPVVNLHGQLVGVIDIGDVADYMSHTAEDERLKQVGLREEEDIYAPIWQRSRNRWAWLGLNLVLAVVASRVIGAFEATIAQQVALAALLPVVANIGGNTGNQAVALVIRGLALDQVNAGNLRWLAWRESAIALVNGTLWGAVAGAAVLIFYGDLILAGVTWLAIVITLALAALAGSYIPYSIKRANRDPVMGSTVILTFVTDSLAFFIFLGLASVLLI